MTCVSFNILVFLAMNAIGLMVFKSRNAPSSVLSLGQLHVTQLQSNSKQTENPYQSESGTNLKYLVPIIVHKK